MSKGPRNTMHDPAFKELQRLVESPALEQCPTEIKEGVKKAMELAVMRDNFCEQVSSKSKMLEQIREFTITHDWKKVQEEGKSKFVLSPRMMSGMLEGQFLKMLVALQKPRRVLELGMYTGCGAVAMAEALPADGTLVTIDREPYLREVAQQFYDSFPQGSRIKVKIGEMKEVLKELLAEGQQFDLMFFDADKQENVDYYKVALDEGLLAPGGTIVVDNALWKGQAYLDPPGPLEDNPLRFFIHHVRSDPRVELVLLPVNDGMMIIRRKADMEDIGGSGEDFLLDLLK